MPLSTFFGEIQLLSVISDTNYAFLLILAFVAFFVLISASCSSNHFSFLLISAHFNISFQLLFCFNFVIYSASCLFQLILLLSCF